MVINRQPWFLLIAASLLAPALAQGGACDAHYPFDGSLVDAGGNGYDGALLDKNSEPAVGARFVPGIAGQALRVTGDTFVRTPLNLQTTDCPKVTITAWVYFEDNDSGPHTLFSTGFGIGPRLDRARTTLTARGGVNNIGAGNAIRPGIWIFVAGVWDYEAGTHRLYWNNRYIEEPLGDGKRPPQEYLWIGANGYLGSVHYIANNVLIDDVRVYGRLLAPIEIANAQRQHAQRAVAPMPVDTQQKAFSMGTVCDAHYPLNGNLQDISGNRYHGRSLDVATNSTPAAIEFVPGRHGQAIRFDGTSAVIAPFDLHWSLCPRVTVTAWVYFENEPSNEHNIVSTGFGSGPRLAATSARLKGIGGGGSVAQKNVFEQGKWTFVVGRWDYAAGVHSITTDLGTIEEPLGEYSRPPQQELWLGTYSYNQTLMGSATGVRIDDVRVYGEILDAQQLADVKTNAPDDKYALPGKTDGSTGGFTGEVVDVDDFGGAGAIGGAGILGQATSSDTDEAAPPTKTIADMEEDLLAAQERSAGTVEPELTAPDDLPGSAPIYSEEMQEDGFEEYQRQQNEEFENKFGPRDRVQVAVARHQGAGKVAFAARPFEILEGPAEPSMSGASSGSWRPVINDLQELLRLKNTTSYLVITKDGRYAITGQTQGRHADIVKEIDAIAARGRPIDLVAEDGKGYVIISGTEVKSSNAPAGAVAWAEQQLRLRAQITALALLGDGAWIGASARGVMTGGMRANHYGIDVRQKATELAAAGERIEDISAAWTADGTGVISGSWAIATDKQVYFQNASDCDNHEEFGLQTSIKLSRQWSCHVPVEPCLDNRAFWSFSDMESPADPDFWDINVLFTIGVADYDGEEIGKLKCWLENSMRVTEELFDRSPAMRIRARLRRATEKGGQDLSQMVFASEGDYRRYMEDNFDIVAPTQTSGYFQVVVTDRLCIGTKDGQPKCIGGRATFPHAVEPFSRKYGISLVPSDDDTVLAHEFGHYLGLKHTFEPYGITTNTCNKDYDANWLKMEDRYCRSCLSGMDLANDTCDGQYNIMDYCENPDPPQQVYVNDCQERRAENSRDRYMKSDGRTKYGKMKGAQ
ncbi:MAG: hypothetical protein KJO76_10400 [Gammaproteobacteria bacterium]|nr:hypothetical protein [Gammaproteobacteria bacterium]